MAVPYIIVPARLKSSRLPDKPLADIAGKPMIIRVLDKAYQAINDRTRVVAAIDNERVFKCVEEAGYRAVLTDPDLPSGSDRVAAAAAALKLSDDEKIINLQGDEPAVPVSAIEKLIKLVYALHRGEWATLLVPGSSADLCDPNVVKAVTDKDGAALYFSRAPIPFDRDSDQGVADCLRHIGLYGYHFGDLKDFVSFPTAAIENAEKLEQLRALYNGVRIRTAVLESPPPHGVDTPAQLAAMQARDWT